MSTHKPPMAFIAPGVVYRRDDDATHSPMFHQIEAFLVDRRVTMADLSGVLAEFAERFFGAGQPRCACARATSRSSSRAPRSTSAAPSASSPTGRAPAAASASGPGWVEILGCGMIHPVVFESCGIDPEAVDRLRVRHGRSSAWRWSATASPTCGCSSRTTRGFSRSSEARRRGKACTPMKASYQWLRALVPQLAASPKELAARFTAAGLEVEGTHEFGAGTRGVSRRRGRLAPGRTRRSGLNLVTVDRGADAGSLELVCGAPNVPAPGGLVVLAPLGAHLPAKGMTIERRAIAGVTSEGMLCSEAELGLTDDAEGILVLPRGRRSRADARRRRSPACATRSSRSASRRTAPTASATSGSRARRPRSSALAVRAARRPTAPSRVASGLDDRRAREGRRRGRRALPALRRRGGGRRHDRSVAAVAALPPRVARRAAHLERRRHHEPRDARVRPPDARVRSRPACAGGKIVVRRAREGGEAHDPRRRRAHARGRRPRHLRRRRAGRARGRHGRRRTARSARDDEAGAPRVRVLRAARRAARVAPARAAHRVEPSLRARGRPGRHARRCSRTRPRSRPSSRGGARCRARSTCGPKPLERRVRHAPRVAARADPRASTCRGTRRSPSSSASAARSAERSDGGRATSPSRRTGPTSRARSISSRRSRACAASTPSPRVLPAIRPTREGRHARDSRARARAPAWRWGSREAITYAFLDEATLAKMGAPAARGAAEKPAQREPGRDAHEPPARAPPGSTSRARHGERDARLFTVGPDLPRRRRAIAQLPEERASFAAVLAGERAAWLAKPEPVDVWDAKGIADGAIVQRLTTARRPCARFGRATARAHLHPRGAARIARRRGRAVGRFGPLHPDVRDALALEIAGDIVVVELDLDALERDRRAPRRVYRPIPRFPASARDLAARRARRRRRGRGRARRARGRGRARRRGALFDRFVGGAIPAEHASLAFRVVYRAADRTLTDAEVDAQHAQVVSEVKARFGATLRA